VEVVLVVTIGTEGSEDKVLAGLSRPINQSVFEVHAELRDGAAGAFARLEELGVYEYRVMEREPWRFSGPTAAAAILEHLPDWGDVYARRKHAGS
jgi:hypothetical protein